MCLLCYKTYWNQLIKRSKFKEHSIKFHWDKKDKVSLFFEVTKGKYLNILLLWQLWMTTLERYEAGFRASYNFSLLIAGFGKPHSFWQELILSSASKVIGLGVEIRSSQLGANGT